MDSIVQRANLDLGKPYTIKYKNNYVSQTFIVHLIRVALNSNVDRRASRPQFLKVNSTSLVPNAKPKSAWQYVVPAIVSLTTQEYTSWFSDHLAAIPNLLL